MFEISILKKNEENQYTELLNRCNEAMFFHSVTYKNLLENFLSANSYYLIVKKKDRIIGALPTFIKKNNKYGNIINSLPFFGSNGGFLVDSSLDFFQKKVIKKELIQGFLELNEDNNCILSTIVTSPFENDVLFYEENLVYNYKDFRIGNIKNFNLNLINSDEDLKGSFAYNCRRRIKSANKYNLIFEHSDNIKPLFEMHKEGLSLKNGVLKPLSFFEEIIKKMRCYYELTYAKWNSEIIAGLLLFKFKNIIEYITPAYYVDHATKQGISFLIYESMKRSLKDGFTRWNFGGTNESQKGVYMFKKSWRTDDCPYYYYTMIHGDITNILEMTKEEILDEYKWFYVIPFKELDNKK